MKKRDSIFYEKRTFAVGLGITVAVMVPNVSVLYCRFRYYIMRRSAECVPVM